MRTIIALVLLLAIPTFAAAQQQADPIDAAPVVELERSTPAPDAGGAALDAEAPETDLELETRDRPMEDAAAMQEPGSRQWWWLVGAIVVGGLIVALIL